MKNKILKLSCFWIIHLAIFGSVSISAGLNQENVVHNYEQKLSSPLMKIKLNKYVNYDKKLLDLTERVIKIDPKARFHIELIVADKNKSESEKAVVKVRNLIISVGVDAKNIVSNIVTDNTAAYGEIKIFLLPYQQ